MKKHANYTIDFTTNTVTVAAGFYDDAATNYSSESAEMIRLFQKDGFIVVREKRQSHARRHDVKLLSYQQMQDFLNLLDDHEIMLAAFNSLREAHKHSGNRLKTINEWFHKECPLYGKSTMYEWADDGEHIVHNPNSSENGIIPISKAS